MIAFEDSRMLLAGYLPLAEHGFAIPAYRSHRPNANGWYVAIPTIDGDRGSPISDFDILEYDIDKFVEPPVETSRGDLWLDVFLWEKKAFVGTAKQILAQLKPLRKELERDAPLSLLDLVLAAGNAGAVTLARRARSFLVEQFGSEDGHNSFQETVVRPGVVLAFSRLFHRLGKSEQDFDLAEGLEIAALNGKYEIELSEEAMKIAADDDTFHGEVDRFARRLGLDLQFAGSQGQSRAALAMEEDSAIAGDESSAEQTLPPAREYKRGPIRQIAIETGADILISTPGKGLILNEPALVIYDQIKGKRQVLAVGYDARQRMNDRNLVTSSEAVRPWSEGDIVDDDAATDLLRALLEKVAGRSWFGSRRLHSAVIVAAGSTKVQRRLIREILSSAGAKRVSLIECPLAAAIGANMNISEPVGRMIIHVGSGATEVAVIALAGIAYSAMVRAGTEQLDRAIVGWLRSDRRLMIGEATAERIRQEVGVAQPPADGIGYTVHVKGRDQINGVPKEVSINQGDIAVAVADVVGAIIECVRMALENVAPELSADIVEQGVVLTGIGANLSGLDVAIAYDTGLAVVVAEEFETCAIIGAARALETLALSAVLIDG